MLFKIVMFATASAAIYLLLAVGLVMSQRPPANPDPGDGGIGFAEALEADYASLPRPVMFTARDGTALAYRRYDATGGADRFVILVHGSAWHGMQFHPMAAAIADAGLATVIVPDMRGHGKNPVRRGDVDHIGQLEEDIADLIGLLGKERPDAQIVLGGHSSGGGFVVRFAGGRYGDLADANILLAPFLKYNAPTTRENSGGWARPATRRIIGLTMLNAVGIRALNHLPVISFAMPAVVLDGPLGDTATTAYTYRMNTSFAPRSDYGGDLAQLGAPFLVVAGDADESFRAELYEETIAAHVSGGTYRVLPEVSHLGVVTRPEAIETVLEWLRSL